METYHFYATPQNGMIRIPDEYMLRITDTVKVIIQEEAPQKTDQAKSHDLLKSDMLLPPTMSTKGWKFNRAEANERC